MLDLSLVEKAIEDNLPYQRVKITLLEDITIFFTYDNDNGISGATSIRCAFNVAPSGEIVDFKLCT